MLVWQIFPAPTRRIKGLVRGSEAGTQGWLKTAPKYVETLQKPVSYPYHIIPYLLDGNIER